MKKREKKTGEIENQNLGVERCSSEDNAYFSLEIFL